MLMQSILNLPEQLQPNHLPVELTFALNGNFLLLDEGREMPLVGNGAKATAYDKLSKNGRNYSSAIIELDGIFPTPDRAEENRDRTLLMKVLSGSAKVTVQTPPSEDLEVISAETGSLIVVPDMARFRLEGRCKILAIADGGNSEDVEVNWSGRILNITAPPMMPELEPDDVKALRASRQTFVLNIVPKWHCSDSAAQAENLPFLCETLRNAGIPIYTLAAQIERKVWSSVKHELLCMEVGPVKFPFVVLFKDGYLAKKYSEVTDPQEISTMASEIIEACS